MSISILITKENRAGEKRVAMIPKDVKTLIEKGYTVFVEHDAGNGAGFSDRDYENAGAIIRFLENENYQALFKNINLIVRAKRPSREREKIENMTIAPGTIMIGALDPLEKNSTHMEEYAKAGIVAHSIDQLQLPPDDPKNLLAAMSKIAGRLSLLDAIKKFHGTIKKVVIIGFGAVGRAAFAEALSQQLNCLVILTNASDGETIQARGGKIVLLNKNDTLQQQQSIIRKNIVDADIVVTSARQANQPAPLLIPQDTLDQMQKGSVIADLALSEGGNVEGSEHDATLTLGNDIIVTNTSGYPKAMPREASELWSNVSLHFILDIT